jgi:heme-degrading monooxygenase HmoA
MRPHIYRVDKFKVPAWSRAEFIDTIERTHDRLRAAPGFILDAVLEQADGHGHFTFVTVVIWESREAIEAARAAVVADGKTTGFNRQEMLFRFGIQADLGSYRELTT